MTTLRAILYDYRTLAPGDSESLVALAGLAGIEAELADLVRAQREGMRRAFRSYLEKPFYYHRDLFGDALRHMAAAFGAKLEPGHLEHHFRRQWELQERDFALREGVRETLRELRQRGFHLGIVSNIDEDHLRHLGRIAGLTEFFDSILSSEAAGSCKPDRAIFEEALRRAGCAPREALFVGDSIDQDIAGANRAGLSSVLLWHRRDLPVPDREPRPRHVIRSIPDLLHVLERERS